MALTPASSLSGSGIAESIFDAKGDLIAASAADTAARLAVGADGTVLTAASGQATGLSWGSGGGLTALFDSTLGSDQAAIDTGANGIAQTKDHLLFVLYLRTTQAAVLSSALLTFNNDTGANYGTQRITCINTTVTGGINLAGSNVAFSVHGASAQANAFVTATFIVPCYRQTAGLKMFCMDIAGIEDTAADTFTELRGGQWRSTAAISRAAVTAGSGNLLAGSRMTIYGL